MDTVINISTSIVAAAPAAAVATASSNRDAATIAETVCFKRKAARFHKPLSPTPTEQDLELHANLCNPTLVTRRLRELVPLLSFVGCEVEKITPERTVLTASLLETTMNQNGTHQGSVFYLLADYTLGIGMFAALPGCYTIGVHDRCDALPVQFWLKSGSVEHRAPGNGLIRSEVCIPPGLAMKMRQALIVKGRCEFTVPVYIYRGEQLIAIANHVMGLYADVAKLNATTLSLVQVQKLRTSALMVAGLRRDDASRSLADEQGIAIACRLKRATPQLQTFVEARTRNIREYIEQEGGNHTQVVVLGAGLDSKSMEFAHDGQKWFLCDLAGMLAFRAERISFLGYADDNCVHVALDLRREDWWRKIVDAGFKLSESTLIVMEGVSYHLGESALDAIFAQIRELLGNERSRFWLDHVSHAAFSLDSPEVMSFFASMSRLGEPFITGFDDPREHASYEDLKVVKTLSAADVLGLSDAVHSEYKFTMIARVADAAINDDRPDDHAEPVCAAD